MFGVLLAGLVLGQAGSGLAEHQYPPAHHACVTEKTVDGGVVRKIKKLVSDPALCKPGKEVELSWPKSEWALDGFGTDATPSVQGLSLLTVCVSSPLVITDLDDGVPGQVVTVMSVGCGGSLAVNDAGFFELSANFLDATGLDTLTLVFDGAVWYEVARSVN